MYTVKHSSRTLLSIKDETEKTTKNSQKITITFVKLSRLPQHMIF